LRQLVFRVIDFTFQESAMHVTLTENAARRVQAFLAKRACIGLRLGVKTSGCSGMAYAIEFADAAEQDDVRFESHGITLLVDPKSLVYLNGTELDFVREGLSEGFKFNNPNVKNQCGCGESFAI
jgi:iron-sulfur cluster assembly protein